MNLMRSEEQETVSYALHGIFKLKKKHNVEVGL
jgi:hypothetical protein